ncbi:hypothetical protein [Campylobacter jejuni]|uniref:hypothetical protein n=1 Tax=Campylobacter jejuni TaxID=197 RepID=UPI0011A22F04|nr:hypothetical protein [Campylobacter jejuni]
MTFNYKYSLGIYVNDWGFMMGSERNPHVFLGLTKDKTPNELDKVDEELRQRKINQSKILSKSVIIKQFICIRSKICKFLFILN